MKRKQKLDLGEYPGYWPQKYLYNFLKQGDEGLDIHDLPEWILSEFMESRGEQLPEATFAYDLPASVQEDLKKWVKANRVSERLVERDPAFAPAYLHFSNVKLQPRGSWLIHFTNQGPFDGFTSGATMDRLALSTWWKEKSKARCPENLSDGLGDLDYVYGFAFDIGRREALSGARKYGKNAVLFRSDAGVEAWHHGDEEWQVIFPCCSEYDVIPIYGAGGSFYLQMKNSDRELEFDSIGDLIRNIDDLPV